MTRQGQRQRSAPQLPTSQLSQDIARLSDAVTEASLVVEQNQQLVAQMSDILTTVLQQQQELADQLSNIMTTTVKHSQQRRVLMPLPTLPGEGDKENWKAMLELSLHRDALYNHITMELPWPEGDVAYEKWDNDRQDIMELMITSIQDHRLLERIRCLGWCLRYDSPKSTYRKILDALGSEYNGEIELVRSFNELQMDEDRHFDRHPEDYFKALDCLYKKATERHRHIHAHPVRLRYFLEGIRDQHYGVYLRYEFMIDKKSFTWRGLFTDVVREAMQDRFKCCPPHLCEMETQRRRRRHLETEDNLVFGVRLTPHGSQGPSGGMSIFELWEFMIDSFVTHDD